MLCHFYFYGHMKDRLPSHPVCIRLLDPDFVAVELDLNRCAVYVNWLRPVDSAEMQRGLELVAGIASELRAELRKTRTLLQT